MDLEHDPEKWMPVFRKDHAQSKNLERNIALQTILAVAPAIRNADGKEPP
jgi:hypothetical protein